MERFEPLIGKNITSGSNWFRAKLVHPIGGKQLGFINLDYENGIGEYELSIKRSNEPGYKTESGNFTKTDPEIIGQIK